MWDLVGKWNQGFSSFIGRRLSAQIWLIVTTLSITCRTQKAINPAPQIGARSIARKPWPLKSRGVWHLLAFGKRRLVIGTPQKVNFKWFAFFFFFMLIFLGWNGLHLVKLYITMAMHVISKTVLTKISLLQILSFGSVVIGSLCKNLKDSK